MFKTLQIPDYPKFYLEYIKNPYPIDLNLVPPKDKIIIGVPTGAQNEYKEVPEGCQVFAAHYAGGTMVVFKDGIVLFSIKDKEESPMWNEKIVAFLKKNNINAEVNGNDIIVDNIYKVSGSGKIKDTNNNLFKYYICISINADPELIRKICPKPMRKIPKGLSEYGFTRKDILNVLGIDEEN